MGTTYQIVVNIKGTDGMLEFGRFFIGDNVDVAKDTFKSLEGTKLIPSVLRLDLIQKGEGIDIVLDTIGCTLNELEKNCRVITIDIFKLFNLEQ
jgi:hypothetical protein